MIIPGRMIHLRRSMITGWDATAYTSPGCSLLINGCLINTAGATAYAVSQPLVVAVASRSPSGATRVRLLAQALG